MSHDRKSEQTIEMDVDRVVPGSEEDEVATATLQITGTVTLDYPRSRDYPGDCHEAEITSAMLHDEDWGNKLTLAEVKRAESLLIEKALDGGE